MRVSKKCFTLKILECAFKGTQHLPYYWCYHRNDIQKLAKTLQTVCSRKIKLVHIFKLFHFRLFALILESIAVATLRSSQSHGSACLCCLPTPSALHNGTAHAKASREGAALAKTQVVTLGFIAIYCAGRPLRRLAFHDSSIFGKPEPAANPPLKPSRGLTRLARAQQAMAKQLWTFARKSVARIGSISAEESGRDLLHTGMPFPARRARMTSNFIEIYCRMTSACVLGMHENHLIVPVGGP